MEYNKKTPVLLSERTGVSPVLPPLFISNSHYLPLQVQQHSGTITCALSVTAYCAASAVRCKAQRCIQKQVSMRLSSNRLLSVWLTASYSFLSWHYLIKIVILNQTSGSIIISSIGRFCQELFFSIKFSRIRGELSFFPPLLFL